MLGLKLIHCIERGHWASVCLSKSAFVVTYLTHWDRVTHICVSKLTSVGSDNGLSPSRRQVIILTNTGILLIGPLGTNFSETLIEIHIFPFKKMHSKMSSGKCRPFCLGLNVLTHFSPGDGYMFHWTGPPVVQVMVRHQLISYNSANSLLSSPSKVKFESQTFTLNIMFLKIPSAKCQANAWHFADGIFKNIILRVNFLRFKFYFFTGIP